MAQSKPVFNQDSALATTIKNMLADLAAFKNFSPQLPHCVQANEKGVQLGTFMAENSEIATFVKSKKDALVAAMREITDVGDETVPEVDITYFQNWGGNARDSTGLMLLSSPTTVAHVRKLILGAKECNLKVGCGGAYHSWTPLYPDKSTADKVGLLINTYSLLLDPQPVPFSDTNGGRIYLNLEEKRVTISPGVTTSELGSVFLQQGVEEGARCCFLSDVTLGTATYGGIVSTGCHGTGKDQMTLSDLIVSMKIVDCSGEVRTYPQDLPPMPKAVNETDAMNALRLSLGVFGIIVELTMTVAKMKTARVHTSYPTMGELLYGTEPTLRGLVRDYDTMEFFWFPFSGVGDLLGALLTAIPFFSDWKPQADQVWVRAINWTPENYVSPPCPHIAQKLKDLITGVDMGEISTPVLQRYPSLNPLLLFLGFQSVQASNPEGCEKEEVTYAIHFRHGVDFTVAFYCMEFAFPFNVNSPESFGKILAAIHYVVEKVRNAAEGTGGETQSFPLSTCIDFRVIAKSDCLIGPAAQNRTEDDTNTAYIEVVSFAGTDTYRGLFKDIGQRWIELGGLPHWPKQWTLIPGIYETIQNSYGDNLQRFKTVLETLGANATGDGETDPWKMFINSTMQKVLGYVAEPQR